ncbi:MAG: hypothetical protein EOP48_11640 [Sphingobacteriales bacterium]|nr:MAG: hypothetical protein EOP48_11640 [Sphingobacteriales bacterium]
MTTEALTMYEFLKKKFGMESAATIIRYVEETCEKKIASRIEEQVTHLATKNDLLKVKAELIKWLFIFVAGQTALIIAVIKYL